MAIDIDEADSMQPGELGIKRQQLIGRVLVPWADGEGGEKAAVQGIGGRRDMFEVREEAARIQKREDFYTGRRLRS